MKESVKIKFESTKQLRALNLVFNEMMQVKNIKEIEYIEFYNLKNLRILLSRKVLKSIDTKDKKHTISVELNQCRSLVKFADLYMVTQGGEDFFYKSNLINLFRIGLIEYQDQNKKVWSTIFANEF